MVTVKRTSNHSQNIYEHATEVTTEMHAANELCVCTFWWYMYVLDEGGVATVTFAACGLLLTLEATQRKKMASIVIKNNREVI